MARFTSEEVARIEDAIEGRVQRFDVTSLGFHPDLVAFVVNDAGLVAKLKSGAELTQWEMALATAILDGIAEGQAGTTAGELSPFWEGVRSLIRENPKAERAFKAMTKLAYRRRKRKRR